MELFEIGAEICAYVTSCTASGCQVTMQCAYISQSCRSQVAVFHALAFWIGRQLAAITVAKGQSGVPLARAISLQTGMQSSLLALLLATRYFSDPLVRLPCGISVVVMTLAGFGLVLLWGQNSDEMVMQTEMQ